MPEREFDGVLHGATGFVGRLTAAELAEQAGSARIALSGRSAERLAEVRDGLGVDWPLVVVDATDADGLRALAERSAVVASAVGPYARHGLPLVEACAAAGTAYCDLTGETLFVHDVIRLVDGPARATGARIVPSSGFDSVPSDLGVLLLAERVAADRAGELGETALVVLGTRGGFSGGTIDSARNELDRAMSDRDLRRVLADPYSLSPIDVGPSKRSRPAGARRDAFLGRWVAPFFLGPHNERIVRRSAALHDPAYGSRFSYREVVGAGRGPTAPLRAGVVAAVQAALFTGLRHPTTRRLLDRILPEPGTGPSAAAQAAGYFRIRVHTETTTGARYVVDVSAQGDPGYAATAVMFSQSALCLALDDRGGPDQGSGGGVLTPATAMGDALVDRLRERGFTFRVRRVRSA